MDLNKHIWEGWTVQDFIDELEPIVKFKNFKDRKELKKWCMEKQPYYKKYIPEVVEYFSNKLNLK